MYGIRSRIGHLVENAVFLQLLRQNENRERPEVFYDVIDSQEVDFKANNRLYEVKSDLKKKPQEIEKYELLDEDITIVADNKKEELNSLPYYPNVHYTPLMEFLEK